MGSKGSSGGFDAEPIIHHGNKALAIQKDIYNQTRSDTMPWLHTGHDAIAQLAHLMGLGNGSHTMQTREQITNTLKPQYTMPNTENPSQKGLYITPDGRVIDFSKLTHAVIGTDAAPGSKGLEDALDYYQKGHFKTLKKMGFTPFAPQTQTIDFLALQKVLEEKLTPKKTTPDFGRLTQFFTAEDFSEDPGYQFRLREGNKALQRHLAAQGKSLTPEAFKALSRFNQDLAAQEYARSYDRFNINQSNLFNRLAALSGMGQTATAQTAGAGSHYANQASNIFGNINNALTQSQIADASRPSMFSQLLNAGTRLTPWMF